MITSGSRGSGKSAVCTPSLFMASRSGCWLRYVKAALGTALLLVSVSFGVLTWAEASTPCPPAAVEILEDANLLPALLSMVHAAKKQIWIGTYHFKAGVHPRSAPDRLAHELIRASNRGVEVVVVLDRPDDPHSEQAVENRRTAALLERGGVKVYMDGPKRRSHMKVAVVDGRFAIVGSHNLTRSGLRENHEVSLKVDSPCVAERILSYLKRIAREGGGLRTT